MHTFHLNLITILVILVIIIPFMFIAYTFIGQLIESAVVRLQIYICQKQIAKGNYTKEMQERLNKSLDRLKFLNQVNWKIFYIGIVIVLALAIYTIYRIFKITHSLWSWRKKRLVSLALSILSGGVWLTWPAIAINQFAAWRCQMSKLTWRCQMSTVN